MITSKIFGTTQSGLPVTLFTLANSSGVKVDLMDYGATIVRLLAPDRAGNLDDIVLGFDQLADYPEKSPYFGCVAGRFANRIAAGRFLLDGETFQLAINDPPNALHGGFGGFDKQLWKTEILETPDPTVRFTLLSPDGDQAYPGTLDVSVTYSLTAENTLKIAYSATTDRATVINLTNHSYFNLAGAGSGNIFEQIIQIDADTYLPVDAGSIPTGERAPVVGGPFDFRNPRPIGEKLPQTGGNPIGYDHNYNLNPPRPGGPDCAAMVFDPKSGRTLQVWTDQPGVQFYTGNYLTGIVGKGGRAYHQYGGFCLETQHFPDSPNRPGFPSTVLRPGETFQSETRFTFGIQ